MRQDQSLCGLRITWSHSLQPKSNIFPTALRLNKYFISSYITLILPLCLLPCWWKSEMVELGMKEFPYPIFSPSTLNSRDFIVSCLGMRSSSYLLSLQADISWYASSHLLRGSNYGDSNNSNSFQLMGMSSASDYNNPSGPALYHLPPTTYLGPGSIYPDTFITGLGHGELCELSWGQWKTL